MLGEVTRRPPGPVARLGHLEADREPRIGAHGVPVIFVHPKDMGGVLVELMQTPGEPH